MAKIKSVEFPNAHNAARKAMLHAGHAMIHALMHGKQKGDHIKVHMDDGSTVELVLKDAHVSGTSLVVEVDEGVEP